MVREPEGGAHNSWDEAADLLKEALIRHLGELRATPLEQLLERRYQKYRKMGAWGE